MPQFYRTKKTQRRLFVVRFINGAALLLGIYSGFNYSIMLGVILSCLGFVLGFVVFCRMLKSEARKHYQKNQGPGESGPDLKHCLDKYRQEILHHVIN